MAHWRKVVFGSIALAGILFILVLGGIRGGRGSFVAPEMLKPDLAAVSVGHVYAFAARAGTQGVLFDSGPDPGGAGIDALLQAVKVERKDVRDVFLTHCHGDHTAATPLFPLARVWAGAADAPQCANEAGPQTLMQRFLAWVNPPPAVAVSQKLTAEISVEVGNGQRVRALPMPGHTPGSYAYLYDGVLFIGDAAAVDEGQLKQVPRLFNPHPEAALQALHALVQVLGATASPPIDRVCAAHGGCTASGSGTRALHDFVVANPLPG